MPMRLQQIPKLKKMNNLTINVYMTDRTAEEKWPVYISKRRDNEAINLLLLSDNEKCHYTLIKTSMHSVENHIVCMDLINDIQMI